MTLSASELLTADCEVEAFTSGVDSLDAWLRRRAMKNREPGASRTFVALDERRDAGYRVNQAADTIGIRGLLVHTLSAEAKAFYEHIGFDASALDPMTLMITLADLKASLEKGSQDSI